MTLLRNVVQLCIDFIVTAVEFADTGADPGFILGGDALVS